MRPVLRPLHGVLVLDKPRGMSSNQALSRVKYLLRAQKIGHTGTLDPLADGLLPLCLGAATKFAQYGLDSDKTYQAVMTLGVTTTTGDTEGQAISIRPVVVTEKQIKSVLTSFLGKIEQVPPMHSALKHHGKPLYALARAGLEVTREPRQVLIHDLTLLGGAADQWSFEVTCSKGTYIRTLAQDIGEALGCGAHLKYLRRTQSGCVKLQEAHTVDALELLGDNERVKLLYPPDYLIRHWPLCRLDASDAELFLKGRVRSVNAPDTQLVRVYGPLQQAFLGSGQIVNQELIPIRLLSSYELETSQILT